MKKKKLFILILLAAIVNSFLFPLIYEYWYFYYFIVCASALVFVAILIFDLFHESANAKWAFLILLAMFGSNHLGRFLMEKLGMGFHL
jgi:hypothetical protein